jgi:hypothetical protein
VGSATTSLPPTDLYSSSYDQYNVVQSSYEKKKRTPSGGEDGSGYLKLDQITAAVQDPVTFVETFRFSIHVLGKDSCAATRAAATYPEPWHRGRYYSPAHTGRRLSQHTATAHVFLLGLLSASDVSRIGAGRI